MRARTVAIIVASLGAAFLTLILLTDNTFRRRSVNRRVNWLAARAISHPEDRRYCNELLQIAKSRYRFGAVNAVVALGKCGAACRDCVDDLAILVESSDPFVSREAALALRRVGPLSRSALPTLERVLRNGDCRDDTTWFVAEALAQIGPDARHTLPLLRSRLGECEQLDEAIHRAIETLESSQ